MTRSAIDGQAAFAAAVVQAPAAALAAAARRMLWVDPDFAEWPLDDEALLDALGRWLRLPQRQLVLLAERFDAVARGRPRFMAWYRVYAHAIRAVAPDPAEIAELPTVLVIEPAAVLQLVDRRHWRGHWHDAAAEARVWTDRIDALLQRCAPALPATTLGL